MSDPAPVLVRGVNRPKSARPPLIGSINREALLRRLAGPTPVTVRDLASGTSLSVPAVSRMLADLVDAGLVVDEGPIVGGLGRRPHGYRIDEGYRYSVAVDLGQVPAVVSLGTLACRIVARESVDLTGRPSVSADLAEIITRLADDAGIGLDRIAVITVANPGVVDPETGTMQHPAEAATWADDPIRVALSDHFGLPVLVMNDVKMATIGELYRGAGRGVDDFAYLRLDVGVAVGIVQTGRLLSGAHNAAGEVGSIRLGAFGSQPDGRLEDRLSLAPHGTPEVGPEWAAAVGDLIGLIAALLDPSLVLLGGKLSTHLDEAMLAGVRDRATLHCVAAPDIRLAGQGLDAALVGGLSVGADHFLAVFSAEPQAADAARG